MSQSSLSSSRPVAVVTGGSSGIGSAIAVSFVQAGYVVHIVDVLAGSEELPDDGLRSNSQYCSHLGDVGVPGNVDRVLREVEQESGGRLDCLVNNAAVNPVGKRLEELSLDEIARVISVNLLGAIFMTRSSIKMLRDSRGCIVNIGSMSGSVGHQSSAVYAASKAALSGLTKSLAMENAEFGVRVNCVLPSNVLTTTRERLEAASSNPEEFHAYVEGWQWLGRSADPSEISSVCLFLASSAASFVTGAELMVTGGAELGFGPKRLTSLDRPSTSEPIGTDR